VPSKKNTEQGKSSKRAERTEHQINELVMARWTRRLGIFTIILAIISAVSVGILYETDQTSRITNRAYVFISDIRFASFFDGDKLMWSVIPVWENGGNTTAKDREILCKFCGPLG
jgi:hypothetical protein